MYTHCMTKSEQINELATALAKAQGQFKNAVMDCINPHFKSKYASLGSVMLAAKEALSVNGLSIVQTLGENEAGVTLETCLLHSSGQWAVGITPLFIDKQTMQGLGSALTYAKRYAASSMLGIVADQDDDGNDAVAHAEPRSKPLITAPYKGPDKDVTEGLLTVPTKMSPNAEHPRCQECGTKMLPSKYKEGDFYCPNKKNHKTTATTSEMPNYMTGEIPF